MTEAPLEVQFRLAEIIGLYLVVVDYFIRRLRDKGFVPVVMGPDNWLDHRAAAHRELPLHGVQFHPESVLTENGHLMLARFLELCDGRDAVERAEGLRPLMTAG